VNKLALASFWVILSLLGLVFAVGMALLVRLTLPMGVMLIVAGTWALFIISLQYLLGPFLIDWIVQMHWCAPKSVNQEFAQWFSSTCRTFGIREPRFGIIEDGAPNAFTYGHGRFDARVVITRGVIDMLSPEELRAVVAHELGHIKHGDFILMTVVQGLVLALYALYIVARSSGSRNSSWVLPASFIAYQLSYYISLYLSRVREYMADYASAHIMGTGNPLSIALVKICYGLAQSKPAQVPVTAPSYAQPTYRQGDPLAKGSPVAFSSQMRGDQNIDPMDAVVGARAGGAGLFGMGDRGSGLLGIAGAKAGHQPEKQKFSLEARTLGAFGIAGTSAMRTAIAWTGKNGQPDPMNFTRAARWELYNPWSRIAELLSTHPMTVRRIQALQKLNGMWGIKNVFDFSKIKPGKYTGFFRDLVVLALPGLLGLGVGLVAALVFGQRSHGLPVLAGCVGLCLGRLLQVLIMYPGDAKPQKVIDCLDEIDVSHVKPIPVIIQGTITGRVAPGVFWASDFILQDDSGFVTCVIHMPFGLEWLYGWIKGATFVGQPVTAHGWYRRFTAPYVEVDYFVTTIGGRQDTHVKHYLMGVALLGMVIAAGLAVFLL
jgi:Zn-dependent protease with chaperone function